MLTDPQTHKHKQANPQTGPIAIHCAAKLLISIYCICIMLWLFAANKVVLYIIPSITSPSVGDLFLGVDSLLSGHPMYNGRRYVPQLRLQS